MPNHIIINFEDNEFRRPMDDKYSVISGMAEKTGDDVLIRTEEGERLMCRRFNSEGQIENGPWLCSLKDNRAYKYW